MGKSIREEAYHILGREKLLGLAHDLLRGFNSQHRISRIQQVKDQIDLYEREERGESPQETIQRWLNGEYNPHGATIRVPAGRGEEKVGFRLSCSDPRRWQGEEGPSYCSGPGTFFTISKDDTARLIAQFSGEVPAIDAFWYETFCRNWGVERLYKESTGFVSGKTRRRERPLFDEIIRAAERRLESDYVQASIATQRRISCAIESARHHHRATAPVETVKAS